MKRIHFYALLFLLLALTPIQSLAFEQAYQRKTEAIYATVRYSLAVYDDVGGGLVCYLSEYKGIKAWEETSNWLYIEFRKDGRKQSGYITNDDLHADCLIYDGREKQLIADGKYQITAIDAQEERSYPPRFDLNLTLKDHFDCKFIYLGDDLYKIMNTETKEYMQPDPLFDQSGGDFWGSEETAGAFYLKRDGSYFSIQDSVSGRYLIRNSNGLIFYDTNHLACWKIRRYGKAITDESIRNFAQFDAEWADYYYGPGKNDNPSTNVFTTSACGIFSTVNAIYSLTGMYASPYELARFAVNNGYRILDNGTDNGIFKAVAYNYGDKYGFSYDGSSGSIYDLQEKLKKGDVAITHVPGHYTCIVDYDEKEDKYLLLDPHYLPKRATFAYGDWISRSDLESGNLMAYEFFFYEAETPKEQ